MRRLTLVAALLLHSISTRGCAKDLVAPTASECSLEGQLHNDSNLAKHDTQHMMVESASACRLECCKIPDCGGFTFAPRVDWPSKSCDLGTACSKEQQKRDKTPRKSKYVGVTWDGARGWWTVQIGVNGVKTSLRRFQADQEEQAALCFDEAARKYRRPVNFPRKGETQATKRQ